MMKKALGERREGLAASLPASAAPDAPARAYDDAEWPIVRVRPPSQRADAAAFRKHLDDISTIYERKLPFVLLVDLRHSLPLSPRERQLVAERIAINQANGPWLKAMAVLMDSRIHRGIFTAIHWLVRPKHPTAAFEDEAEARRWLIELVRAEG